MAIKIGGTEVITDGRGLRNITTSWDSQTATTMRAIVQGYGWKEETDGSSTSNVTSFTIYLDETAELTYFEIHTSLTVDAQRLFLLPRSQYNTNLSHNARIYSPHSTNSSFTYNNYSSSVPINYYQAGNAGSTYADRETIFVSGWVHHQPNTSDPFQRPKIYGQTSHQSTSGDLNVSGWSLDITGNIAIGRLAIFKSGGGGYFDGYRYKAWTVRGG